MKLSQRERRMVTGLTAVVLIGLLYVFAVRPALERTKTLQRVIPEKHKTLQALRTKSNQYLATRAGIENLQINDTNSIDTTGLIAVLESITNKLNLTKKVATMTQNTIPLDSDYSEIVVQTQLNDITLEQLVQLLHETSQTHKFLRTKSLYIKTNKQNPNLLDSEIHISAIRTADKT
jgi:type II secretory pathway component PulM